MRYEAFGKEVKTKRTEKLIGEASTIHDAQKFVDELNQEVEKNHKLRKENGELSLCLINVAYELGILLTSLKEEMADIGGEDELVEKADEIVKKLDEAVSMMNLKSHECDLCGSKVGKGITYHDFRFDDTKTEIYWHFCLNCAPRVVCKSLKPEEVQKLREKAGAEETFLTHYDFYDEEGNQV